MDLYFILLLVSAIFTICYAELTREEIIDRINGALHECRNITGITADQISKLDRLQVPTEKEPQCFLACIFKTMDVMQDDNKFSKDAIIKLLEPYKKELVTNDKLSYKTIENIIDSCIPELTGNNDECVAAKNAMECALKYAKKEGIIP